MVAADKLPSSKSINTGKLRRRSFWRRVLTNAFPVWSGTVGQAGNALLVVAILSAALANGILGSQLAAYVLGGFAALGLVEGAYRTWHEEAQGHQDATAALDTRKAKHDLLDAIGRRLTLGRAALNGLELIQETVNEMFTADPLQPGVRVDASPVMERARTWEDETYDFLNNRCGHLYAARFRNDIGVPSEMQRDTGIGVYQLGREATQKMIQRRIYRLEQISHQIEDAE